ncbi:hypothetical protein Q7P37_000801 [Cladosporium fusiforme]
MTSAKANGLKKRFLLSFQNETRNGFNLPQHGLHTSSFIHTEPYSMVGVPRRSRGCEACKKRRLTCDLGRPKCSHCKQEKRDCHFPNAFTFVVNDPGTHKTVYRKPSPGRRTRKGHDDVRDLVRVQEITSPSDGLVTPNDDVHPTPDLTMGIITSRDKTPPLISRDAFIPNPTIPQQISTILPMQQQLLSHALQHFSTFPTNDSSLIRIWIPTLQNFATSTAALKASPLACCAAWLARGAEATTNPSLVDFSRHLYAQGLSEVRTALRVPGAILEDETLGACLALAVFEVIQCPDKCRAAYEWHRRASVNLVQMRGAKRHREGVGHDLFLAVRLHGVRIPLLAPWCIEEVLPSTPNIQYQIISMKKKSNLTTATSQIFYAYEQRRPNFLCTRQWCTVPWESQPKDDFHRLADILARGPQLIYESDELPSKPLEQRVPTLLTILSRLLDIDADLEILYGEFEDFAHAQGERLYWEGEKEVEDDEDGPSPLHFPSLRTASLLTLHWSILTMVWSALSTLHTTLTNTSFPLSLLPASAQTTRFLDLAPRAHWLQMVRNITRSTAYCIRAAIDEGARTPPGIGVALEIVIDVMKDKEGEECRVEMMRAMRARVELGRRWVAILLA